MDVLALLYLPPCMINVLFLLLCARYFVLASGPLKLDFLILQLPNPRQMYNGPSL